MEYPTLPSNLKQAPYQELARADNALRQYKNVTILGIRHWRAIPQLKEAAKQVNRDQRRVLKEIKARPEFRKVILPSPASRAIIHSHVATQLSQPQPEKIQVGDRVRSKFHNADGEVVRIEWTHRVGSIYHIKLDTGAMVYVAREDLSKVNQ